MQEADQLTFDIEGVSGGPFATNAYLITDLATKRCAVVDPGYDADTEWGGIIRERGLTLESILLTHGHIDHTCGVAAMMRAFPGTPVWLHKLDLPILAGSVQAAKMFGLPPFELFEPTHFIIPGEQVKVGETAFDVLFVPGHTPGHVAFLNGPVLVSGDVIFQGSVGRTDLPGGDTATLAESIRNVIMKLPDETQVCSGHGPVTTIGMERRSNPFVREWIR